MSGVLDEEAEFFARMTRDEAERFMLVSNHPMRDVVAEVVDGRPITDLGCGRGIRIKELYRPDQYRGIDASEHLVDLARAANPGYSFSVSSILDFLSTRPDKSIDLSMMVAVLEHAPSAEAAVRIYNEARRASRELLIGWHVVPRAGPTALHRVKAELEEPIWQNHYDRGLFGGTVSVRPVQNAELWTVRD